MENEPIKNLPLLPKQKKAMSKKLEAIAELQKQKARLAEINKELFDLGLVHNIGAEGIDDLQVLVVCW